MTFYSFYCSIFCCERACEDVKKAGLDSNSKGEGEYSLLKEVSKVFFPWSWDGWRLDSIKPTWEEEIFDVESKEGDVSFHDVGLSRWNKMQVLLGPEVLSMIVLLKEKSKILLDQMIFFDEGFEWRFEVEWKDGNNQVLSWKTLPNLDQSKCEESDEVEETLYINEK